MHNVYLSISLYYVHMYVYLPKYPYIHVCVSMYVYMYTLYMYVKYVCLYICTNDRSLYTVLDSQSTFITI